MHMKRFICLLLVCAMLLCGCGASAGDNETSGLKELDVVLDWYPNALHAFLYVAIEKGYYEEEGLKVNIRFPSNANDAISLVAAGQADIGLYYQQDVIQARAQQDVPVKSIGAVVQGPLNIVLSLKEKGITSAGDMVGKTIGYAGTNYDTFLQNLDSQKISYAKFDSDYVAAYKENNTSFDDVLADVAELFGLVTEEAAGQAGEDGVTSDRLPGTPSIMTSGLDSCMDVIPRTRNVADPPGSELLLVTVRPGIAPWRALVTSVVCLFLIVLPSTVLNDPVRSLFFIVP